MNGWLEGELRLERWGTTQLSDARKLGRSGREVRRRGRLMSIADAATELRESGSAQTKMFGAEEDAA